MKKINDDIFIFLISISLLLASTSGLLNTFKIYENKKEIRELKIQIEENNKENALLKEKIENLKGSIELLEEENFTLEEEVVIINDTLELDRIAILEELSDLEWNILYRVARSEAGSWSREGQMHVVYVVLNRMESERFSNQNTISEVVFAPGQFSVVENGSFYTVEVSEFTMENVHDAYINWRDGERFYNALFFHSGPENPGINYIAHDEVGHHFY